MEIITNTGNKFFKMINSIKTNKHTEQFIIEGKKFVSDIPIEWKIDYYIVSESFAKNSNFNFSRAKTVIFSDRIFNKLSNTVNPQGILAVCKKQNYSINSFINKSNSLIVILENINDPGNLGTIIRTSHAAAADGIIITSGSVDLYNPKVLRASASSVFYIPIVTNIKLTDVLPMLSLHNINILSTSPTANIYPYFVDLTQSTAILIGNEATGLTPAAKQAADMNIKLPMLNSAESLNASVSCAIMLYEAVRQRNGYNSTQT